VKAALGGMERTMSNVIERPPLSVYFGFAAKVSELFQKGVAAGLTHEQLIKVAEDQLALEKRMKESHDRDQRFY
jgi:hypothetical protein